MVMIFNATFNNISVISWRSVLMVEETGIPKENHRPVTIHWQTLSLIKLIKLHFVLYQHFTYLILISLYSCLIFEAACLLQMIRFSLILSNTMVNWYGRLCLQTTDRRHFETNITPTPKVCCGGIINMTMYKIWPQCIFCFKWPQCIINKYDYNVL